MKPDTSSRFLWISVAFCVAALLIFTASLVVRAKDLAHIQDVDRSTNRALCTLKRDLELRYLAGLDFLADNPDGIPGFPRATIQRSLANQKSTLEALSDLKCS